MTVESNYVIAIATFSDWLKRRASFSTNEKPNQNHFICRYVNWLVCYFKGGFCLPCICSSSQFLYSVFIFSFFSSVLESAWRVPEWQSMKDALAQVRFWTDHEFRIGQGNVEGVVGWLFSNEMVMYAHMMGMFCRACWGL